MQEGKCFKISQRKFIDSPFTQKDFRKISPRMFTPYDSISSPEQKYFKDAILNYFPDDDVRANFLNKFYQCLVAGHMPAKVYQTGRSCLVLTNSSYYITTNDIPYFGSDDANVKRRIVAFETTSLPSTPTNVEKWMRKNSIKLTNSLS